jgi:tryptophan halogenase
LIQRGIALLLQFFPDRHFRRTDIDYYNRQMAFEYERIRDFLLVHYTQTRREGEFWEYCRNMKLPDSLAQRLELFRGYGRIVRSENELFNVQSWLYLFVGQDVWPSSYDPIANTLTAEQGQRALDDIHRVVAGCAAGMPFHEAFIAQHCRSEPRG